MVRRIAEEIAGDIVQLGVDGRLVKLQLEELMGGVDDERRLVMLDYFTPGTEWHLDQAMDALAAMGTEELLDATAVAATLQLPGAAVDLDAGVQPRGHRLLARIPRLPETVIERIVNRFGSLQKIMRATIDDLDDVTGVGQARARAIKDGLSRLAESSILDRYS
jgi:diadenylate cyclase